MFERITLPYAYGDLEPHIDAATVETHYEKHHKTYTDNLNNLVKENPELQEKSILELLNGLDELPEKVRTGVRNNGGGFYNHNLYFESLAKDSGKPTGKIATLIDDTYGDLGSMLDTLHTAATATLFGSGYAWLILKSGKLDIVTSANQDLPKGNPTLLLPVDMWEHAYYLKYKNDKKTYVKEFYKVINWEKVEERLEKAQ